MPAIRRRRRGVSSSSFSTAARTLVSGRSGFVGLVLPIRGPSIVDSFLGEFVTGLGEGLVSRGSHLILATAPEGRQHASVELQLQRELVGRRNGHAEPHVSESQGGEYANGPLSV